MSDPNVATLEEMATESGGKHEPPMQEDFPRQREACELLDSVSGYDDLVVALASARVGDPLLYEAVLLRIDQVEGAAAVGWVEQEVASYTDAAAGSDGATTEQLDEATEDGAAAAARSESTQETAEHHVELDLSAVAEGRQGMGPKYIHSPVMKAGRVAKASPYLALRKEPRPDKAYLNEDGALVDQLHFNDEVFVLAELAGDWYHISSTTSGRTGYVANWTIRVDPPEPAAQLYAIETEDTLIGIAEACYGTMSRKGQDLRFYVNALRAANQGCGGLYRVDPDKLSPSDRAIYELAPDASEWMLWGCKSGFTLWIPSASFAESLSGQISNGSVQEATLERVYEEMGELANAAFETFEWPLVGGAYIAGLLHGALESLWDLVASLPELGELAFDIFDSMIRFELLADAEALFDEVKALADTDLDAFLLLIGDDLSKQWYSGNAIEKGHLLGWITGYAVIEVVMMALSGGALTAVKWTGRAGKFSSWLKKTAAVSKLADRIDAAADTNKAVARARKLINGKKKKADLGSPDPKKADGPDKPRDKDAQERDKDKKRDDEDEHKPQGLANKAARQGFEAAAKAARSAIRDRKQVLADAERATAALSGKPGVKLSFDIDAQGRDFWGIKVVVTKDGERAHATRGKGWIAHGKSATRGGSEASKWYLAEDQRPHHEQLVTKLDAELETEAAQLVESGKGGDMAALRKALTPAVRAAEASASKKMIDGIAIELDEDAAAEGKDEQGQPALVYPYTVSPNMSDKVVTVSTAPSVDLSATTDVTHPWLAAVPIRDLGPYKFIPRGRTFGLAFDKHSAALEQHDRAGLWEAAREDVTYQAEELEWEGDRKSAQRNAGKLKKMATPNAKLKEKRVRGARERLGGGQKREEWIVAILAHDNGRSAMPFTSLTDHENVESSGHSIERHVLGSGRFHDRRDIARRAAFNYGENAPERKASAFEQLAAADNAASSLASQVQSNWKSLRNDLLRLNVGARSRGIELSQPGSPSSSFGYAAAADVTDTDQPEYLSLGSGVRPLFDSDTNSAEWTSWYSANQARAQPSRPICSDLQLQQALGIVRPTRTQSRGGWYFKTVYPSE